MNAKTLFKDCGSIVFGILSGYIFTRNPGKALVLVPTKNQAQVFSICLGIHLPSISTSKVFLILIPQFRALRVILLPKSSQKV
jgi:hypothetical protein